VGNGLEYCKNGGNANHNEYELFHHAEGALHYFAKSIGCHFNFPCMKNWQVSLPVILNVS
jgi:hypothetical protein